MAILHGNKIYSEIKDRNSILFILLAGTTEISKIRGISAAGETPELTALTPVLDSEIIWSGKCISYDVVPMTENGIPTPSIITRAAIEASRIETLIVDAGLVEDPKIPFMKTGLGPALNGSERTALPDYDRALEFGKYIGGLIDGRYRYIFIAESVPGGTTTAYSVLSSLGIMDMTSSSMKDSPDSMKREIAMKVLERIDKKAGVEEKIRETGDYMMPVALGISSAVKNSSIFFSGGTQMATVLYLDSLVNGGKNRYVFTTGYIMKDKKDLMEKLAGDRIIYSTTDFTGMRGLEYYEEGYVKEGTGFGAAFGIAHILGNDSKSIYNSIGKVYRRLAGSTGK
ncbi:MAG: nicotinate-nucleotide--dimethylbenzimidazole phosphoribosyltransferase [Ferroplasma sp.]|uniref:nicotinate-nucleotide--dimethylbenzimidazole phosphoribosyltransferase n=1 Tax=Ferroplasma sp. TaxID=2591003 RepID=UPI002814F186|nr:nicotinate-nucleotide--dimethylbenzimidazole phosphoribosyltransferase [Ferroplasma sp.]WMT51667.1 MAG: nicotinate-nucleotide--dimethylbenzimidazole phosphoribosyltransferase [Ferroplasma sp.]